MRNWLKFDLMTTEEGHPNNEQVFIKQTGDFEVNEAQISFRHPIKINIRSKLMLNDGVREADAHHLFMNNGTQLVVMDVQ